MKWKFWEKLTPEERAELRAAGVDGPDESVIADMEARVDARLAEERAKDREALRAERTKRLETEATYKADELLRAGKLTPPEREQFIAFRAQQALEDAERPPASAGAQSRVGAFDAIYDARPSHRLFTEYITPGTGKPQKAQVLQNATGTGEREKDITTPEGAYAAAAVWAAKQNGAPGKNGA